MCSSLLADVPFTRNRYSHIKIYAIETPITTKPAKSYSNEKYVSYHTASSLKPADPNVCINVYTNVNTQTINV